MALPTCLHPGPVVPVPTENPRTTASPVRNAEEYPATGELL